MLNKRLLLGLVLVGGWCLTPCQVNAQTYYDANSPFRRDPRTQLSPYLNLTRDAGLNPAVDYYLGVLPERNRRSNAASFGSSIQGLQRQQNQQNQLLFPSTGQAPVRFNNTGGYFPDLQVNYRQGR